MKEQPERILRKDKRATEVCLSLVQEKVSEMENTRVIIPFIFDCIFCCVVVSRFNLVQEQPTESVEGLGEDIFCQECQIDL